MLNPHIESQLYSVTQHHCECILLNVRDTAKIAGGHYASVQEHWESSVAHHFKQGRHQRDVYEEPDSSDALDDTDDDTHWSDLDDSDERVCNENWTGEVMKMWEDLRIN